MKTIAYAELPSLAGQDIGVSDWVTITQEQINLFADATGDHQWIHVDVDRAKKEMGINYGLNKLRFTNMVPVGSRVRLREKCLSVEAKAGGLTMTRECTVEIEGQDRPALVAEWVTVLYG